MKNIIKFSVVCLAGVAFAAGFSGKAQAAGPYSCTDATYGSSYSTCSTNNTANQASTVATAATVLRAATAATASQVANRVSAALDGSSGVKMASNGFSASSGLSAGDMGGKAGVWVSGSWTNTEDENTDTKADGDIYTGTAGVDFRVAPNVVIGISGGYESVDIDTEYNDDPTTGADGNLDGDGWTVAPYVGVKLSPNASADLTAGYSDLQYDTLRYDPNVTGQAIRGSTDAERYFVSAGVNGKHNLQGNWNLKGRGSVFYASEDKDAFTETQTNGATVAVAENTTELGQILVDARLGYTVQSVEPYALVGVEYDFTKDEGPVAAGQSVSDSDFGAKFGGGLNLNLGSNVTGGIEAYTVEFRDDYNEYAVTGGLRVNF